MHHFNHPPLLRRYMVLTTFFTIPVFNYTIFPLNVPRPLGYWLNLMAFFRPISLALVALLAAAIPDAAQAFAPSSLRAVGAAKAQLPAVPAPRRARFAHAPLRRRTGAGRVCAGQRLPGGTLRMQTRASRVQRAPV